MLSLLCLAGARRPAFAGESIETQINEAIQQYAEGNFHRAMSLCTKVMATEPNNLRAHYLLGDIYMKNGETEEAAKEYSFVVHSQDGHNSPVVAYSRKALARLEASRAGAAQANAILQNPPPAPIVRGENRHSRGQSSAGDNYLSERVAALEKEAQEKIAIKKRVLDDKIKAVEEDMRQDLAGFQPVSSRRMALADALEDSKKEIRAEAKAHIDELTKEFERDAAATNEAYDERIRALIDSFQNH